MDRDVKSVMIDMLVISFASFVAGICGSQLVIHFERAAREHEAEMQDRELDQIQDDLNSLDKRLDAADARLDKIEDEIAAMRSHEDPS
jgi:uncharacterized protein YPO0396